MFHITQRFEAAVCALVGEGKVKQRLADAYAAHLEGIERDDLPQVLRDAFTELDAALHRVAPVGKESGIKASVQKMSFSEAASYACMIAKLYAELVRHGDRAEPLKVVEPSHASVPR